MSNVWNTISESPLYDEHLLLGGIYDDDEPLLAAPVRYGGVTDELDAHAAGCGLTDLSGMTVILVSGEGADAFMHATCANEPLGVGLNSFGAVVTGDGQVAAVPLVSRTGDHEYLMCDVTERGLALMPWMSFLAGIEQNGFRPFDGVQIEDVSDSLHPLLLWGPQAPAVLADYLESASQLPEAGQIVQVALDNSIQSLAASIPLEDGEPCYLLLVPPQRARTLWRSLLSFAAVTPVGVQALTQAGRQNLPWLRTLLDGDALLHEVLVSAGLARTSHDYVGARALVDKN